MNAPRIERRRSPRIQAEGAVWLTSAAGARSEGTLADISGEGFRARHSMLGLCAGETVGFAYQGREGRARLMWTRIHEGVAESGFLVIEDPLYPPPGRDSYNS